MIDRERIPDWYFYVSLSLILVATVGFFLSHFGKSLDDRMDSWRRRRKLNTIASRHLTRFSDFVEKFRSACYPFRSIQNNLRQQFEKEVKEKMGLLPIYLIQEISQGTQIENALYNLKSRCDESGRTFKELLLFVDQLNLVEELFQKSLTLNSIFVREIGPSKISRPIEREYEDFREKYNDFVKDYNEFLHQLNQEVGERIFWQRSSSIKKW